ncbi:hypothetical protein [Campylobacter sp. RM9328]|uniref:hypothetical protein n=1 Tax=Campylobacter sp. RM9328 TaxID=1705720 RepID=UPI00147664F1|nr:hypothetical protein [Campylobacter sp. RM9328]
MRTKFPFTIEIDDEKYELLYTEHSKKQLKELENGFLVIANEANELKRLNEQIASLEEKKAIKKELAKLSEGKEKSDLSIQILDLIDEITQLKVKVRELESKKFDIEELPKKRFDMSVSGTDIEALKLAVENKGISYLKLIQIIDEAIIKEREKK